MLFILIVFAVWAVAVVGWILNIIKIVKALKAKGETLTPAPATPLFIARCIGVIAAPLGAVLGYIKD